MNREQWSFTWNETQHIDAEYRWKMERDVCRIREIKTPLVRPIKQWHRKKHDNTCARQSPTMIVARNSRTKRQKKNPQQEKFPQKEKISPHFLFAILLLSFPFSFPSFPKSRLRPVWRSGNGVCHINEVMLRRARLLLGW